MFCRKETKGYIRHMHLIDQYFELLLLGDRPLKYNCFETTGHPSNHLDKGSEERVERQHQRDNHRVIPVMSYPMDGLDLGPDHVQLTKVNWGLKVNWENFPKKILLIFPIHFISSESCALSKLNCKHQKSIANNKSQLELP